MSPLNRITAAQHVSKSFSDIRDVKFLPADEMHPSFAFLYGVSGVVYQSGPRRGTILLSLEDVSDATWDDMASHELLYWTFLHECGHMASAGQPDSLRRGCGVTADDLIISEYDAWHWAIRHSAIPMSNVAWAFMNECLRSYEHAYMNSDDDDHPKR